MSTISSAVSRWRGATWTGPLVTISLVTLVLFAVSPVIAPGSLQLSSLASMLPFAAILAVAAIGQTLVVQQGGLDFSVPGTITLAAVVLTKLAGSESGPRLGMAIAATLAVAIVVGLCNGLLITKRGITPLIATLGTNALQLGAVQQITGGLSVVPAPESLSQFALGATLGVFNTVVVASVALVLYCLIVKCTVVGRRFEATGASQAAARLVGIPVNRYRIVSYAAASLSYAIAGIMLAGYLRTPGLDVGDSYLLATIAAVVVGGTALTGGAGSALATAIAALFLSQLNALLLAAGSPTSVSDLLEGLAIGMSMGARQWFQLRDGRTKSAVGRHRSSGAA